MHIRHPKDFLTGVMFISFGAGAMALSSKLAIGTAAKMGPGFFPFVLGGFLAALGCVILMRGIFWAKGAHSWPVVQLKPVGIVLLSVVLFSYILHSLGLLLSTAALVILTSKASHEFRWKEALLNAAVLGAIVLVVFVYFLEFQLPVWPSFTAAAPEP